MMRSPSLPFFVKVIWNHPWETQNAARGIHGGQLANVSLLCFCPVLDTDTGSINDVDTHKTVRVIKADDGSVRSVLAWAICSYLQWYGMLSMK